MCVIPDMTPDLSTESSQTVGQRIALNTTVMVGAKILAVTCGIATFVVASRALEPSLFGTLVFIHAYMLLFAELATFQTWQALIRFGAEDIKKEDVDGLSKLIKFGFRLDIFSVIVAYIGAVALMGLVVWLVQKLPVSGTGESVDIKTLQTLIWFYCLVVLTRIESTPIGILRLFNRFGILALLALVMPVLRVTGSLYVVWRGATVEAFLIVWFVASMASYVLTCVFSLLELKKRNLLVPMWRAKPEFRFPRKGLWPFAIKANIDASLGTCNSHLPTLMVTAIFGPVWTGTYKIAEEISKLLTEAFKLLDQAIYPELAKLITGDKAEKIWRLATRAAAMLFTVGSVFAGLIFVFGEPALVAIFGGEYRDAAPLASLLVSAAALMGVAAPFYPIFYAASKPEWAIYVRGSTVLVYLMAFFALSFTISHMAPGWAMLVGNMFCIIVLLVSAKATMKSAVKYQNQGLVVGRNLDVRND